MLLRDRCDVPPYTGLAVYNPAATPKMYAGDINDAARHWSREVQIAARAKNKPILEIGTAILQGFVYGAQNWNNAVTNRGMPNRRKTMELARRVTLSTLAVSMLLETEWPEQTLPEPVGADGVLGTMFDMVTDEEEWVDYRVHTPIGLASAMADTGFQWYKSGNLVMCQTRPADPTTFFEKVFLPKLGIINPDFSGHETLFPFVLTR